MRSRKSKKIFFLAIVVGIVLSDLLWLYYDFYNGHFSRKPTYIEQSSNFDFPSPMVTKEESMNLTLPSTNKMKYSMTSSSPPTLTTGTEKITRSKLQSSIQIGIKKQILRTPFYGMLHRETSGIPLSHPENRASPSKYDDWKVYFPKTFKAIDEVRKNANSEQNGTLHTHSFNVTLNEFNYTFGEEFVATIKSIDGKGNFKTYGGDYYRARLITKNTDEHPDGIPCRVIDNEDGSYTINAPLMLKGTLLLDVTMVMSIEGIHQSIVETEKTSSWSLPYVGELETHEKVICDVNLTSFPKFQNSTLCDYSNPRNGEPWFCEQPSSKNCSKLIDIVYGSSEYQRKRFDFQQVCKKYGCLKKSQMKPLKVNMPKKELNMTNLLFCKNEFKGSYTDKNISGFIQGGIWRSIGCKDKLLSFTEALPCFKNKVIYFIGDSTIRQFFYLVVWAIKLRVDGPDNSHIWQQPKVAYDPKLEKGNITLFYRAHGPPLQNPGPPNTRPYISDLISDIPVGGKNVYVIFNIGAHLFLFNPKFYLHRLKGIRKAIISHHSKYPETKFIVRGLNVVTWNLEWQINRLELLLHETFRNLPNVMFLNFWDFTTVWPLNDYHPTPKKLNGEALYMFRCICS